MSSEEASVAPAAIASADAGPRETFPESSTKPSEADDAAPTKNKFVIIDAFTTGHVGEGFNSFLEWFRDQPTAGTFAFIFLYIFATVAFIPGSILTLGAGFIFSQAFGQGVGIAAGTAVVFVGASVGATLAFLVGRYVLRDWVAELVQKYRIMRAVDAAIKEKGAVLVLLLRLSPVVPFSAFNYIMSATSVGLRDYMIGFFGMIPGTAAFVYFGSLLSSVRDAAEGSSGAEDQNPALRWSLLGVGLVATIAALVFISIYAKRALNAALLKEEAKEAAANADSGDVELGVAQPSLDSAKQNPAGLSATEVQVAPPPALSTKSG